MIRALVGSLLLVVVTAGLGLGLLWVLHSLEEE